MKTTLSALVLASAIAVAASSAPAAAGDASTVVTLKPRQGISLDLGAKRSVGYFLADSRLCNLTLLVADATIDETEQIPAPTRLQFEVGAGSSVRVDTTDGKALSFGCATDAKSMTVTRLEQMAAYVKQ